MQKQKRTLVVSQFRQYLIYKAEDAGRRRELVTQRKNATNAER